MKNYNDNLVVGVVKEIRGTSVIIRITNTTTQLFHFYKGEKYSGVMIGTFIGIQPGRYTIVGKVEKEYAYDRFQDIENQEFSRERFIREVEVKIVGSFLGEKFFQGMVAFPQIFNNAILLPENLHEKIYEEEKREELSLLPFGNTWPDNYQFRLQWDALFNTHIAIFGNTGSGKSNTLTKMYHELFNLNKSEKVNISKSKFILIDFNGEYIGRKVISTDKQVFNLGNLKNDGDFNKIYIPKKYFWDVEMLSIIFGATEQTQKPFLKRVVNFYIKNNEFSLLETINYHLKEAFRNVYMSPSREGLNLLKYVIQLLDLQNDDISEWIDLTIYNSTSKGFYSNHFIFEWDQGKFWNPSEKEMQNEIDKINVQNDKLSDIGPIKFLQIVSCFQMIFEIKYNQIQYDHIAPLLQRIQSRKEDIESIIVLSEEEIIFNNKSLNIISLKNVNQDLKMLIPLMITKITYDYNKEYNLKKDHIVNLIIDEAHNILSNKSNRESEKWKDYRLEVFEEIVKEGRKFNFYLTISSQRPADISPTIISQVHNYFIHRLVNENDLKMLDNTMSTLDLISKESIPNLAPGQLVCTGTSFKLPLIVQVDELPNEVAPKSKSALLSKIWIN
ncbi:ATP-binding protein [Staphylococcus taiwanensis]|nr:ATP-binding protein [Staphylococcus taiwanensis]